MQTPPTTPPAEPGVLYLDNGRVKIGIDLNLGGAITYFAPSGTDRNVVNSHDWGRQIQMSFYSGPTPFAPNGKQPKPEWAGLGWNPIQSGDVFGNRARVLESRSDRRQLSVRSIPMHWPLDNEPSECTFESTIRLDGPVARVVSRLVNHRVDKTQYPARDQELPAVYTNGPYYHLMTYQGDEPFTGGALSEIQRMPSPGFPWAGWQATENWAALVDDSGWGLGVYHPGLTHFIGGFSGTPGKGGPKDNPTGYIAPVQVEILDHDIVYEYHYDLILGTVAEIRDYVRSQAARRATPDYRFARDRQHWHYDNAVDGGWPIRGEIVVGVDQANPQIVGPDCFFLAAQAPKLRIEAAFRGAPGTARVYWKRYDAPTFAPKRSIAFPVPSSRGYTTYMIPLASSPEFRGAITGLRIDPPGWRPGESIHIRRIAFE